MKLSQYLSRISQLFTSVLGVVTLGLVLNAAHLARTAKASLAAEAPLAVFLSRDASIDIIGEKLQNLEGIARVELIGAEKVLEKAQQETSFIKEVLVGGQNPFTPYFLLQADTITPDSFAALKTVITGYKGVEEVRYDSNRVTLIRQLSKLAHFYRRTLQAIAAVVLAVVAFILIRRLTTRTFNIIPFAYTLAIGFTAGFAGAGLYHAISTRLLPQTLAVLPGSFLMYFMIGGVICSILIDN